MINPSYTPERFLVPKAQVTKQLVREFYDWALFDKSAPDPSISLLGPFIKKGWTVLNLGCGSGAESAYFAQRGCRVVGVDISPKVIALARSKWTGLSATFLEGDMVTVRLNEAFDLVLLHDSLEHVFPQEQEPCLLNAISHLKQGGFLFVKCPHPDYRAKHFEQFQGHSVNPQVYQILDEEVKPDTVVSAMRSNGLDIVHYALLNYEEETPKLFLVLGVKR